MERPSGEEDGIVESTLGTGALVSRSCVLDDVSVGAVVDDLSFNTVLDDVSASTVLDDMGADTEQAVTSWPRFSWVAPGGLEVVGCGAAAEFVSSGPHRFRHVQADATRVFGALSHDGPSDARPRAFGGFSFHDARHGSPGTIDLDLWRGFEAAWFVIPRVQVTDTDDGTVLTVVESSDQAVDESLDRWREALTAIPATSSNETPPGVVDTRRITDRGPWTTQVERALGRIERGELEKVVLARALRVDLESTPDVPVVLERLGRRYPGCYRFGIDHGNGPTFFGASPERLVEKRGTTLSTEALAGSVPRGDTPEADEDLLKHMYEDEKLRREHEHVVDAIRTQLTPLADDVTLGDRRVRRLATIQHLLTPITATLDPGTHVLEVVEALHPTPAMGGVPQRAACEAIRELERFNRGWYAAPIGWFDANGDGEFAVGIRSGLARPDRSVTLFGGNGIVADSDPHEEFEEVQLKLQPILDELR